MNVSIETARNLIGSLVERYRLNRDRYRSGAYNEETCRREFIDPFFEALGWDLQNRAGAAEQYKDLIHEEGIKVGDFTKAPDYTFRFGGVRKFFVEAKKPFIDLKIDPAGAYQLRRYGWSSKLALSILTDFEEFSVYDTRTRPHESDKAAVSRVLYLTFEDYLPKLSELWDLFSKEAVLRGLFDRYAEETRGKRGTTEVDQEFLKELESWRESLAKNLALRNTLTVDELNYSVQVVIDRILFLRIAEARGAEEYGRLLGISNGPGIYGRLRELFRRADEKYDSGLFDLTADRLTPALELDDKTLDSVLKGLYYPESPYEFSVMPAEILGSVYERFLGKIIRLTQTGHRATIEEKPEVKRAGGVFYTPNYVVRYIVGNTLGTLCSGMSPKDLAKIKVLDPACGSGSFLIVAYQLLLDLYLQWYVSHGPERQSKRVYLAPGGWRLTTSEKHRILLNSIYGVDIDRQAVEVTKLSLLLKVLEGQSAETIRQFNLYGERALPSLENNVKCGNTLISPEQLDGLFPDPQAQKRINPFDWRREFPDVLRSGGFHAVIGNPPYVRIQTFSERAPLEAELLKKHYRTAQSGNYDIYATFVEKGLALLRAEGRLGFILPQKFWQVQFGQTLRLLLTSGRHLVTLVNFRTNQVFSEAFVNSCIVILSKASMDQFSYLEIPKLVKGKTVEGSLAEARPSAISAERLSEAPWVLKATPVLDLLAKVSGSRVTLEGCTDRIFQGLKTSADRIYALEVLRESTTTLLARSTQLNRDVELETALCHRLVKGTEMRPYVPLDTRRVILFPYERTEGRVSLIPEDSLARGYPLAYAYLRENKDFLRQREGGKAAKEGWYAYGRNQALEVIQDPKILTPDLAPRASFLMDFTGETFLLGGAAGGYGLLPKKTIDPLYLLALLNSRLLSFFATSSGQEMESGYFSFEARFIRSIPIGFPTNEDMRLSLVQLASDAIELRKKLLDARVLADRNHIERQIDACDSKIDHLVYELYELSPDEIAIVEEIAGPARKYRSPASDSAMTLA